MKQKVETHVDFQPDFKLVGCDLDVVAGVLHALLDLVVALVPLHLSLGLGPDLEIRKYSFYIRRHDLE